jgi:hypothetical protein
MSQVRTQFVRKMARKILQDSGIVAFSAIRETFVLSLPATNFPQFRQYDSSRGDFPGAGRCSNCGLVELAGIGLQKPA